jgi:subtilisin family serine protease
VISVSSHDNPNSHFYANPSPPVDFSAPGIDVKVPWLDHKTMVMTGNSFAAPYITGLVTLIKAKHPNLHPAHVKVILHALAANVSQS